MEAGFQLPVLSKRNMQGCKQRISCSTDPFPDAGQAVYSWEGNYRQLAYVRVALPTHDRRKESGVRGPI